MGTFRNAFKKKVAEEDTWMVEDAGAEGRIILKIILTRLKPSGSFTYHQVIQSDPREPDIFKINSTQSFFK